MVLILPDLTEADQFFANKCGLMEELQCDLCIMWVTSLEEAILVMEVDQQCRKGTKHMQGHPNGQARHPNGQACHLGPSDSGPVSMEIVAVQT